MFVVTLDIFDHMCTYCPRCSQGNYYTTVQCQSDLTRNNQGGLTFENVVLLTDYITSPVRRGIWQTCVPQMCTGNLIESGICNCHNSRIWNM